MHARQGVLGSAATYRWPASACPPGTSRQLGTTGQALRAFEDPTASAPMRPPTSKPNTTSLRSRDQLRVHFPPLTSPDMLPPRNDKCLIVRAGPNLDFVVPTGISADLIIRGHRA